MVDLSLNNQRVVAKLEQALRRYDLVVSLQIREKSGWILLLRINWLVNRIAH